MADDVERMATALKKSDLERVFSHTTLSRGTELWAFDAVSKVVISPDGASVTASVKGSKPAPYVQVIGLTSQQGRTQISGDCSCPMEHNCKHVAAVLLEVMYAHEHRGGEIRDVTPKAGPLTVGQIEADEVRDDTPAQAPVATAQWPLAPQSPVEQGLSAPLMAWLHRLTTAAQTDVAAKGADGQRALVFVLNHDLPTGETTTSSKSATRIRAMTFRINKAGATVDVRSYALSNMRRGRDQQPQVFTEDDIKLLNDLLLQTSRTTYLGYDDAGLTPDLFTADILTRIVQSGRLRYGHTHGPTLVAGPTVAAAPQWVKTARGTQRLAFIPTGIPTGDTAVQLDHILPLDPPLYVALAAGQIGRLLTDAPLAIVREIVQSPEISMSDAGRVKMLLRHRADPAAIASIGAIPALNAPVDLAPRSATDLIPLPEAPDDMEFRPIRPVPRLRLMMTRGRLDRSSLWYTSVPRHQGDLDIPIARLAFDYGDARVDFHTATATLEHVEDGKLILTPRDGRAELAAVTTLTGYKLAPLFKQPFKTEASLESDFYLVPPNAHSVPEFIQRFDETERFLAFSMTVVPQLIANGWRVEYADDYPYRLAEGDVSWWADTKERNGIDWISFELGIDFEGHKINLVPQLANMLAQLPPAITELAYRPETSERFLEACSALRLLHVLPDGRMLPLPGARLAPILMALLTLIGPGGNARGDGEIRLQRNDAAALALFAATANLDVAWAATAEKLLAFGRRLIGRGDAVQIKPPKAFKADLRPYQLDGLTWLNTLREVGFGGVLADDMGLGKTIQALALLAREKHEGRLKKPVLIIAPTSVIPNWQAEAARFAPKLKVLMLRGADRAQRFNEIGEHDIVLSTYPLLIRDQDVLLKHEFHMAILDEAQAIKNPKAAISIAAHQINARHRFALTGTPVENNLGEVWSLFQFLMPGLLGTETTFRRVFRTPIEKNGDIAAQAFLSQRLKPFMLR
jgi:hypothetical protein